jgi:hypothetical protein
VRQDRPGGRYGELGNSLGAGGKLGETDNLRRRRRRRRRHHDPPCHAPSANTMALRLTVRRPLSAVVRSVGDATPVATRAFAATALRAKDVVNEDPNLPNMRVRLVTSCLQIREADSARSTPPAPQAVRSRRPSSTRPTGTRWKARRGTSTAST